MASFERPPVSLQVAGLVPKGKDEEIGITPAGFAKASSLVSITMDPQNSPFQHAATECFHKQKEESLNAACAFNTAMAFPKCFSKTGTEAFNMQGENLVTEESAHEVKDIAIEVKGGNLEDDCANGNSTMKALGVDPPAANMQSRFWKPVQLLWCISSKISLSVKSFLSVKLTRTVKAKAGKDLDV